jgi:hypothetical protein
MKKSRKNGEMGGNGGTEVNYTQQQLQRIIKTSS